MLKSIIIKLNIENVEYEIFLSPISLHSKTNLDDLPEEITHLYFYNNLKDDLYKNKVQNNEFLKKFESEKYILNYGQDFKKYYLGCCDLDSENKTLKNWRGNSNDFREKGLKMLTDSFYNHSDKYEYAILFTVTKPEDINLG